MSSKRHSILPAIDRSGPKPPVNFSSSLIISDNAILQGTHSITMQAETVIHPRCRFESNDGSVLIGRRCIIHERAHIGARPENPETAGAGGVSVGDYVQIEVGSIIESGGTEVGEGSLIQVGSKIGSGTKIGSGIFKERPELIALGLQLFGQAGRKHEDAGLRESALDQSLNMLATETEIFKTAGLIAKIGQELAKRLGKDFTSALALDV
ncbi:hypothetical protein CRV24_005639 [Beauveria bassiana]|nr:hypothetical protein CRV24_005639 [Beauveria bassiana]